MGDALDVCVLGRVGYDLYAVEQGRPLAEVEHFSRHLGGSSANIAVGLARLGRRVAIISAVGDDALADYLIGFLDQERVDARRVTRVAGYGTSLCLTEVSPPDRFPQVFYRYKPADSQVQVGEAELALIASARLFVTNGTSLCASPSRESTMRGVEAARAAGARTVLDIDYRPSSWASPEEAGRAARAVLPWIDVVIGNEDEVALLTGQREPRAQVKAVLDGGAGLLVRKLGAAGVEALHARDLRVVAAHRGAGRQHDRRRRRLRVRIPVRAPRRPSSPGLPAPRQRGGGGGGQPRELLGRHALPARSGGHACPRLSRRGCTCPRAARPTGSIPSS